MTEHRSPLYHRHRFPAAIIAEAAWLYFRFPLSFRMVETCWLTEGSSLRIIQFANGLRSSGDTTMPTKSVAAHHVLLINGIWMNA
jgi:hypothetical protein